VNRSVELLYGAPKRGAFDSERGFLEYVLQFANGDTNRAEMRRYVDLNKEVIEHPAGSVANVAYALLAAATGKRPDAATLAEADATAVTHLRTQLREVLSCVMVDRARITEVFLLAADDPLKEVWLLPIRIRVPGGVSLQYHAVINNPASFTTFALILLLDVAPGRNFARDLCRCRLKGCDRFFLARKPKTGRPQRLYCTRKHMLEAHTLGSTKRVQRSRARRALALAKRKPK
jgi:hypothetical protein